VTVLQPSRSYESKASFRPVEHCHAISTIVRADPTSRSLVCNTGSELTLLEHRLTPLGLSPTDTEKVRGTATDQL
jgi:hypothetical protein